MTAHLFLTFFFLILTLQSHTLDVLPVIEAHVPLPDLTSILFVLLTVSAQVYEGDSSQFVCMCMCKDLC